MAVSDSPQRLFALGPGVPRAGAAGPNLAADRQPAPARLAIRAGAVAECLGPVLGRLALALVLASGPVQAAPAGSAGEAPRPRTNGTASLAARCAAAQRASQAQASQLRAAIPRLEALLLGEIHTSTADHAWQLATLEAVRQQRPRLSLGLEMIPAARQAVLDRYSAGAIDEASLLRQVGWQEVWGHDPDLYLPLLRWARQQGVPLLALNAEPDVVRRVRRQGLAGVPVAEREGLGMPAAASPAYRQRLQRSWQGHRAFEATPEPGGPTGGGGPTAGQDRTGRSGSGRPAAGHSAGPPGLPHSDLTPAERADLQGFVDSQLLRDRAMAERIAAAQRRDPQRLVVALIGRGHLEDGDGVPRQLTDLGLRAQLSLTRIAPPDGCGAAPARARLGAYLESEGGAVWVRRVAPESAAAAAGLRPGDRILELNGMAVDHAGQVIRGVRLHPDGVPLRLTIERAGRRLRLQLQLPPSSEPRQASRDNGVRIGDGRRPAPWPFARPAPLT